MPHPIPIRMGGTLLFARLNRRGLQQAALSAMNDTSLVGASSSSAAAANSQTSTASIETKLSNINLGSSFAVGTGNDTSNISSSIPEERMSNMTKGNSTYRSRSQLFKGSIIKS